MDSTTTRRNLIKTAGLAGALGLLPGLAMADGKKGKPGRKRLSRIAHFTDPHVSHVGNGSRWLAQALEHVNGLSDAPSMILFGGDMVFDGNVATKDQMAKQWSAFNSTLVNHNDLPVKYCIGNHDVWGGFNSQVNASDVQYGKKWIQDTLQLESTYYSFDRAGWHFVVLDSIAKHRAGYIGKLGREQMDWFNDDLDAHAKMPTLVMSHIPILSACAAFLGNNEADGARWQVHGANMHIDGRHIKDLFVRHPSVKVCVSGHIHLVDRVDYNGVSYLCNGAVSGNWWRGNFQETAPGYALIDLFDDGTWHREYMNYGWKLSA